jgi:glycosyltransferase involved in cell wall biosynthesis
MRVVHLSSVHHPADTRIALKMCSSLAGAGHEVHLVVCGEEADIPPRLKESGVTAHLIKPAAGRLARMTSKTREVFQAGAGLDGDIYHFHDPEGLPQALKWRKKLGRPFIYDVHEPYPDRILTKAWLPRAVRRPLARAFAAYENYAALRLDGLVVVTEHIAARFARHPRRAIVHNYALKDEFQRPETQARPEPGCFVYAGGLTRLRGVAEMAQAAELAHPPARLILAGRFESPSLQDFCAAKPRVAWLGHLGRDDLGRLLARACAGLVVLQPTKDHQYFLPTKMFEYMAAGLPVIASDFPLWREIVTEAGCGLLVDPRSPRAIAEAMNHILAHPVEAAAMGRRGRAAVEGRYNWEAEFHKLLGLYAAVSRSKGGDIHHA